MSSGFVVGVLATGVHPRPAELRAYVCTQVWGQGDRLSACVGVRVCCWLNSPFLFPPLEPAPWSLSFINCSFCSHLWQTGPREAGN